MAPQASPRAGFTLIELLVCVAIIALLASMLVPSLGRARNLAQRVKCLSQLHSLCAAALFYAEQNRECLPVSAVLSKPEKFIREYCGGHYRMVTCPSATLNFVPENARRQYERAGWMLTYGVNNHGYGPGMAKVAWPTLLGRRIGEVANPTVLYIIDADAYYSPHDIGAVTRGTLEWPVRTSFEREAYLRHLGGYCASDMQGSARWYDGRTPNHWQWWVMKVRTK